MIDILIPCLGRPESILRLAENIHLNCESAHPIFIVSAKDMAVMERAISHGVTTQVVDWKPGHADYAKKMNHGYRHSTGEWLFLGAQDIEFTPGWWDAAMRNHSAHVIATNDKANQQVQRGLFGTHCLVRRSYVDEHGASADGPGVLIHEGYDHNFVDRELCGVAQNRRVFAFAKDSVVLHHHPLWRTAPDDATYKKALRHFHDDRKIWLERSHLWNYAGMNPRESSLARQMRRKAVKEARSTSR